MDETQNSVDPPIPPPPPPQTEQEPREPEPIVGFAFPAWIKVFLSLTAMAFLFGLLRLGHMVKVGVNLERGNLELARGHYVKASEYLAYVHHEYPDNSEVAIDLASAYEESDQLWNAVEILKSFEGREVTTTQNQRLDDIEKAVLKKVPPEDKTPNKEVKK